MQYIDAKKKKHTQNPSQEELFSKTPKFIETVNLTV